ncbi:MAG: hypothetical protein V3T58_06690 [Candidatus Hydrothermarchaeales archaeon]
MKYKDKVLLFGFTLSNVSALIYEVVWSRQLTYLWHIYLCCEHDFDLVHVWLGHWKLLVWQTNRT